MKNIQGLIKEFESYSKRKSASQQKMEELLHSAADQLQQNAYNKYFDQVHKQFHDRYKSEFQKLGEKLNRELDRVRDGINSRIAFERSADYELKLSNALKMLEVLNGKDISENMETVSETVKPFSYDQLARKAIEKLLSDKSVFPMGLFDDTTPYQLQQIEAARSFADEYDNQNIASDMVSFFTRTFDDFDSEAIEIEPAEFSFNFSTVR